MATPRFSLPLHAASHEVSIHASHGHTHPLTLELTPMVAGVAVPATHMHSSKQQIRQLACAYGGGQCTQAAAQLTPAADHTMGC
jgi:hypothetical protein